MTNHHITLATTLLLTITTLHALNITHQECLDTIAWCQNPNTLHLIAHNHHNISLDCLSKKRAKKHIKKHQIIKDNSNIQADILGNIGLIFSAFPSKSAIKQAQSTSNIITYLKNNKYLKYVSIINDFRQHHNLPSPPLTKQCTTKPLAYYDILVALTTLILGITLGHTTTKRHKPSLRRKKAKKTTQYTSIS